MYFEYTLHRALKSPALKSPVDGLALRSKRICLFSKRFDSKILPRETYRSHKGVKIGTSHVALNASYSYDPISLLNGAIGLLRGETREEIVSEEIGRGAWSARSLEAYKNIVFQLRVR